MINDDVWAEYEQKQARMAALQTLLTTRKVDTEKLAAAGVGDLGSVAGQTWAQLLKRPEVGIQPVLNALSDALGDDPLLSYFGEGFVRNPEARSAARAVETEIKFAGYLDQQRKAIDKLKAAEAVSIPDWIDYSVISGLSREMRETLERVRPITIGQASRIPGVTPAALSLVHVSIRVQGSSRSQGGTPRAAKVG